MSDVITSGPLVATSTGPVSGRATDDAHVFLGVPYAAPPSGAGRFAAPQPHEGWTEVRDATQPGPTAPQPFRSRLGSLELSPFFGEGWIRGDDYLTVNVWAPRSATAAPVVVFVHGGAFIAGSTSGPVYDGSAFARDGVVFVSVNYRLGVAGFLHLPDAPDNRGLLDVRAALQWVRQNAAAFGGDPDNVTLMGQSAGAIIVSSILTDPDAPDLMRRAIVQSGNGLGAFTTEQATRIANAVAGILGVEPTASSLAGVKDELLVGAVPGLAELRLDLTTATHRDPLGSIAPLGLVLDEQPADALARHAGSPPDLLIGWNLDESSLYVAPRGLLRGSTDDDVASAAAQFFDDPAAAVSDYRAQNPEFTNEQLRVAILSDGMFISGSRRYATTHAGLSGVATHVYEFRWRSNALDSQLGCSHLMELPFVFDRTDLPELHGPEALLGTEPPPPGLADTMHSTWVRFAATGEPGWRASTIADSVVHPLG